MCLAIRATKKTKRDNYVEQPIDPTKRIGDSYVIDYIKECGTCDECRGKKARDWVVRCHFEHQINPARYFITLTYDPKLDSFPYIFRHSDIQRFLKRLRKHGYIFRYFIGSEYTPLNLLPHYHLIIFTQQQDWFPDMRIWEAKKDGEHVYSSEELTKLWGHGIATIQKINTYQNAVAVYCSLYNVKNTQIKRVIAKYADEFMGEVVNIPNPRIFKQNLEFAIPMTLDEFYARIKERVFSSKSLGFEYFWRNREEIYANGIVTIDGSEYVIPPRWIKTAARLGCQISVNYYLSMLERAPTVDERVLELDISFEERKTKYLEKSRKKRQKMLDRPISTSLF